VKDFTIYRPERLEEAISLLSSWGKDASIYAGGTDLLILEKNRIVTAPRNLIDIKGIPGLREIKLGDDGAIRIGALATLSEIGESDIVGRSLAVVKSAILRIASPELRNVATLGGELFQDVWCPYLRNNFPCYRNGGDTCYAEKGDNSLYHSIMGAKASYAAYPGDLAPVLIALDARATIAGPEGLRDMLVEDIFPGDLRIDGRVQSHVLHSNEILTEVTIPPPKTGSWGFFDKVCRREFDFALVSLCALLSVRRGGKSIDDARLVFGGIATKPYREKNVEEFLKGKTINEDLMREAPSRALLTAKPLKFNGYKVDMAAGLLSSALQSMLALFGSSA
jgi:xanthine dehydrogenase YagS FAD-binding subunit